MARPLRIAFPGAIYHVICRGNNKQNTFLGDSDRFHFLRILSETITRFDWLCFAYCLMDNHFHLLIETCKPTISEGMKFLNGTYTQYFNWTHQRVGHLFQGRFKSPLVQKSLYFRRLCRYIVMNPVKAGICRHPGEYAWSSFNATVGRAPVPDFLTVLPVLNQWGNNPEEARLAYEQYVLEGVEDKPFDELKHQLYLGDDSYLEKLKPFLPKDLPKDILLAQQRILRPSLTTLLQEQDGLWIARKEHKYTITEIARQLNVHPATISRQLTRRKLLGSDTKTELLM